MTKIVVRGKNSDVNPKVDHNINLAGLMMTDADSINKKVEREKEGTLKGYLVFKKMLPSGECIIYNVAEFPGIEAVDLLLYFVWILEENAWPSEIEINGMNKLAKEVFGITRIGNTYKNIIKRILAIWVGHGFYFDNSFIWHGQKTTAMFGVIENWKMIPQGRGKPTKLLIRFDSEFLNICKNTTWYRRPSWIEVRKLRKETAKALYLLAMNYKNGESWKIFIGRDLKFWYRNALNSFANPKYLYEKLIVEKRLKPAINEINSKTSLKMSLNEDLKKGYYITVKGKAVKLDIPFDALPKPDKELLLGYVKTNRKDIKDPYGFLRAMSEKELNLFLAKVKRLKAKGQVKSKVLAAAGSAEPKPEPELESKFNPKVALDPLIIDGERKTGLVNKFKKAVKGYDIGIHDVVDHGSYMAIILEDGTQSEKWNNTLKTDKKLKRALEKASGKPVKVV